MKNTSYDPTASFGDFLRFLRRRARLTQTQLSVIVGYSPGQISMLENGQRIPDIAAVAALFVPALGIEGDGQTTAQLLQLAQATSNGPLTVKSAALRSHTTEGAVISQEIVWEREELGVLEDIPPLPPHWVDRPAAQQRLAQVLRREQRVALCGLPGMGKSSLAAAYAREYARTQPVLWLTIHQDSPLSAEHLLRQMALFVAAYAPYAGYTGPLVRHLSGQGAPLPPGQLLLAIEAGLTQQTAPLLVIDDAHLLESAPDATQLLRRLCQRAANLRLLLISREEISLPNLHYLTLHGLEANESVALVTHLLPGDGKGKPSQVDALLDRWQAETAGNPLLLRLAVTRSQEQPGNAAPAWLAAGTLVDGLLAGLGPAARRILDFLALCRTPVNLTTPDLAAHLSAHCPGYEHRAGLTEIRRRRLVDSVEQASLHPLLREPVLAALQNQPQSYAQMHRLVGQWAARKGDRSSAARHLTQAGEVEAACDLLLAEEGNRERTETLAAVDDLLALCRRFDAPPSHRERLRDLLLLRGDLLIHTIRAEEAQASYRNALELTEGRLTQAKLAGRLAVSLLETGRAQDALDLCEEALKLVHGDLSAEGTGLRLQLGGAQVKALIALSRFDEATLLCQQALDAAKVIRLVKPRAADEVVAKSYYGLGYVSRVVGDLNAARRYLLQSVRYARAAELQDVEAGSLAYLAVIQREMGDLPGAIESSDAALTVAEAMGNEYLVASILHIQSITCYWHDNQAKALALNIRTRAAKEAMLDVEGVIACDILQGLVLTAMGDLTSARMRLVGALLQCQLVDNSWLQGIALYVQGIVLAMDGELGAGEASIDQALGLAGFVVDSPYRASALLYRGIIHLAQGRIEAAQAALVEPLPPGAAIDILLLRELLQAMIAYARDDEGQLQITLDELACHAQATGHLVYYRESQRLAQIAPLHPPLSQLPRLVSCPAEKLTGFLEG